jgi:hypothetical protein
MKDRKAVPALIGEIEKHRIVLQRLVSFYLDFTAKHPEWSRIDTETAMAAAQLFGNYYTCIETIFFRISSFFENNLEKGRWHAHLLERMQCAIPGERPAVIDDRTGADLMEFLKFRHFTRYYFEFDYDREKLAFLGNKFNRTAEAIEVDLRAFISYLHELSNE